MFELRNSALVECVVWAALLCLPAHFCLAQDAGDKIGIFDGRADIGEVVIPGVARFDAAAKTYTVTAAGENMWTDRDAFYLLWKKVSGDVQLTADIAFPRERGRAHRKAVRRALAVHLVITARVAEIERCAFRPRAENRIQLTQRIVGKWAPAGAIQRFCGHVQAERAGVRPVLHGGGVISERPS
jgi:hypothetical protein